MASGPPDFDPVAELLSDGSNLRKTIERSFIEGFAVLLPLLVTLLVVSFVLGFLFRLVEPLVVTVTDATGFRNRLLVAVLTVGIFVALVFLVGFVSRYGSNRDRISNQFHRFMESIPAVGRVYTSFNQMSSLLLDSDTDSFQEVKLVEYPSEDAYAVAFTTAETPEVVAEATGNDDMVTLFMPMAPNPMMGGFVIHVSRDRVVDVDLTVEEGVRSIVTSGVAVGSSTESLDGLGEARMRQLSTTRSPGPFAPVGTDPGQRADGDAGSTGSMSEDTECHDE